MSETEVLQKYWGHQAFRPLQQEIIASVLAGNDTLALLPTGGGKSVCFQVPALMRPGICIVVSPLVALMKDQVENLKSRGIEAVAIYAGMGKREIDILLDNCIYGNIRFLYLSPERLLSELVRIRISYMNVNLIAVDEAHCVSQWGYDFRPSYLEVKALREFAPQAPVLALTATATDAVRADMIGKLELKAPNIFVKSFSRSNLSYVVADDEDKHRKLLSVVRNLRGSGLVYVRNRRETTEVASFLQRNGIASDFYHAGLEKDVRFAKQAAWKSGSIRVMACTNAFGMGIDKADVRFVVHWDLPESLEAYYQEAGRAGRDEKRAYAVLFGGKAEQRMLEARFRDHFPTPDEVKQVYHQLGNFYQLAYGAGEGLNLAFDLSDFCRRFGLNPNKTLQALKFLEHDGYLVLSDRIYNPSRVIFLTGHEELYRFQIENRQYDSLIKVILRSYGGSFDQYVGISESEIAKRTGHSYNEIVAALRHLDKIELLHYLPQTDDPQLTFLRPRTDLLHFDLDVVYLNWRQGVQREQIRAVTGYVTTAACRSQQLLHYFGERSRETCGNCDVCLAERRKARAEQLDDQIDFEILGALQQERFSIDELMQVLKTGSDPERLTRIRELLDAGKIKTDGNNYYL
ncbi:RecQ family ATP-dependent DNA helicase [Pedobacter yulinensis]|uniref:ATP-dependent DNA helicase RecQ n=1 Tax=Pedobacter yulinensis TaxID=2126353 RepID=A0A2T3HKL6_9SPHI|nr:ATP-dependent DNA helicase RecQ [Pedobacter yulinensis]PST82970.1 RecQ family ATP-dependent DNA helicase [Pedobacter yulinensis]